MAGKKKEPVRYGIDKTVGNVETTALGSDVVPNLIEVGIGLRGTVVPLARRLLIGGKPGASAQLHFLGKLAHGFLCDDTPLPLGERSFRLINGRKDFRAGSLALLPQEKGFLHRVFLAPKASTLNGLADKRLLIGSELHFHHLQGKDQRTVCQALPSLPALDRCGALAVALLMAIFKYQPAPSA
jgi:hypothetical protein